MSTTPLRTSLHSMVCKSVRDILSLVVYKWCMSVASLRELQKERRDQTQYTRKRTMYILL